jgi:hypothetical protein
VTPPRDGQARVSRSEELIAVRTPRLPAALLCLLLVSSAVAGCSDDPADTPGGGSVQDPGQQEQAPAVDDGTGGDPQDDGADGGSTTGDADDVEPEPSG